MKPVSLKASQLAFIDLLITRAQEKGRVSTDRITSDDDTVGIADAHHPLFDLSEHDLRIIQQMNQLASQLQFTTTLADLTEMRARAVKELARG